MARSKRKPSLQKRFISFTFRNKRVRLVLDKVLIFRLFRNLHGRFWGIAGMSIMIIGFAVCFMIRPDLLRISTALSYFASDVRTAPYFAGSIFFAAYGLWRWRTYLAHTWKHSKLVIGLVSLTMFGLYLVALFPLSWRVVPHYIHMAGMILIGSSIAATVVIDLLLTKANDPKGGIPWRNLRLLSFVSILVGGWLTLASTDPLNLYRLSLLGEGLMFGGYWLWVVMKTYQGEGNSTILYRILNKLVLIK